MSEHLTGICTSCQFNPQTGSRPDGCRIGRSGVSACVTECPKYKQKKEKAA